MKIENTRVSGHKLCETRAVYESITISRIMAPKKPERTANARCHFRSGNAYANPNPEKNVPPSSHDKAESVIERFDLRSDDLGDQQRKPPGNESQNQAQTPAFGDTHGSHDATRRTTYIPADHGSRSFAASDLGTRTKS